MMSLELKEIINSYKRVPLKKEIRLLVIKFFIVRGKLNAKYSFILSLYN